MASPRLRTNDGAGPERRAYALTGTAGVAQDVWTDTGRREEQDQFSGSEFVLTVESDRFQVQVEGHASELPPHSRVTVTGELQLVGEYEWDAFALSDTRADWLVRKVVELPLGDISVDLAHPSARPEHPA